jgi:hypothetical protein
MCIIIGMPVCRVSRAGIRFMAALTLGSLLPAPISEMLKFESIGTEPDCALTLAGHGMSGKAFGPGWD